MKFRSVIPFLVVCITLSTVTTGFSQFRDYRDATIIKSNGESIVGKVNYKTAFHKRKKILFKKSGIKEEFPVSALKKIVFSDGEVFTVITVNDTGERRFAKTFIDGGVSLHKAGDTYYLGKDTSTYELDDKPITIQRDGTEFTAPSKKYLSALNIAFIDCPTLNYEPLSKGVQLKPLTNLIYQYGKCKDIPVKNVRRKPSIGIVLSGGPVGLKLNTSMNDGGMNSSGNGSSFTFSFLYDLSQSSRFKVRMDLNYLQSDISGNFTTSVRLSPASPDRQEYVSFSTSFQGVRIPIGLQYYFFNNKSDLYLSGGLAFSLSRYEDWDNEQKFINKQSNGEIVYAPAPSDQYVSTYEPIGGLWCAVGGDIRLSNALRLNVELKGMKSIASVFVRQKNESVSIYEFSPSVGLNYKIR